MLVFLLCSWSRPEERDMWLVMQGLTDASFEQRFGTEEPAWRR